VVTFAVSPVVTHVMITLPAPISWHRPAYSAFHRFHSLSGVVLCEGPFAGWEVDHCDDIKPVPHVVPLPFAHIAINLHYPMHVTSSYLRCQLWVCSGRLKPPRTYVQGYNITASPPGPAFSLNRPVKFIQAICHYLDRHVLTCHQA
jgi:hypothetical protein